MTPVRTLRQTVFTAAVPSIRSDVVVGLASAAMNLDAAREVWQAAQQESRDAQP